MYNFEPVIGLEIHVELTKTKQKIFSNSQNNLTNKTNEDINFIDLAFPGTLPQINIDAVIMAIRVAKALNCEISSTLSFDRKNYFYPDNPKQYQITQHFNPIGKNGEIVINLNENEIKKIGIESVQLEEDTAKSISENNQTFLNYNRVGMPLVEIVSKPEIKTPDEAYLYLKYLKEILERINVSDLKMEKGSLRVDANISLKPVGMNTFLNKVEIKNLNSFNFVQKALEFEMQRQEQVYLSGQKVLQETRRYDEKTKKTIFMRLKEGKSDYRYHPEPNIPNYDIEDLVSSVEVINNVNLTKQIEELREKYNFDFQDAVDFTFNKEDLNYFISTAKLQKDYNSILNWIKTDIRATLKDENLKINQINFTKDDLARIIEYINTGEISHKIAKQIFKMKMQDDQKSIEEIIEENSFKQIVDETEILKYINDVIKNNETQVAEYKNGKKQVFGYLISLVLKRSQGKVNPTITNKLLLNILNNEEE